MMLEKYKYILISIFFLTLVIIINLKIPKKHKMSLLLVAILFCIYEPKFLLPLVTSLVAIYLFNKKFSQKRKKQVEHFAADFSGFKTFLKELNDYNISGLTKFIKDLEALVKKEPNKLQHLGKTRFLKDIHDVYFFDFESDTDFHLILRLNLKYKNVKRLQEALDFVDISYQEDYNDEQYRDNLVEDNLLNGKPLQKLGLFVYKSNFINIKRFFISVISDYGLYSIINNKYTFNKDDDLENQKQFKKISKLIYELSILVFYLTYRETDKKFNFNTQRDLEELELYNIIPGFIKNKNATSKDETYIKITETLTNINTFKLVNKLNFFPTNLYALVPTLTKSNLLSKITSNMEDTLDLIFKKVEEHVDKLELLDINFYRMTDRKQRKQLEIKIKSNYFLLLLLSGYFKDILDLILDNTKKLDTTILNLYNKKKSIFTLQVNNEIELDQKYNFSSVDDLFYDNFFYYYGVETKKDIFQRIFIYPEVEAPSLGPSDGETKDDIIPFHKYQQQNFELDLDDYLTTEKLKEKQEESLLKYYQFLDKENYKKIESLNSLAVERNKELKLEKLSFDNIIDNFGKEVFNIIDELVLVFKKFYLNKDLIEMSNYVSNSLNDPSFVETFSSPSPGPSPDDGKNLSKMDTYILFIKIILDILLRKNRILYVGFIFIVLALFIYFIDSGQGYQPPKPKVNSIFDILRL